MGTGSPFGENPNFLQSVTLLSTSPLFHIFRGLRSILETQIEGKNFQAVRRLSPTYRGGVWVDSRTDDPRLRPVSGVGGYLGSCLDYVQGISIQSVAGFYPARLGRAVSETSKIQAISVEAHRAVPIILQCPCSTYFEAWGLAKSFRITSAPLCEEYHGLVI